VGTAYSQTFAATGTTPITWLAPTGNLPPGLTFSTTTGEITGTPTQNGTFTFTIRAENAAGLGSQQITLVINSAPTAPSIPQGFTAIAGNGQVALGWAAPVNDGGEVITGYEVSSDNGATWVVASGNTGHTFAGLTNGNTYAFRVRAVNAVGNSTEASTTATPATIPGAPQNFTATAGNAKATLSWAAPASNGGNAITGYEVSSDNGVTWVVASSNTGHIFTGLTNGTQYTFRVRAVNSVGNGSEASATATPAASTFALTVSAGLGGSVSGTVSGNYAAGTAINVTATANSGYHFTGWTVSGVAIAGGNNVNPVTFVMPANAVTLTANFAPNAATPPAGGGSTPSRNHAQLPRITQHAQNTTVYANAEVTLYVTANVTDGGTLSYQWYRAAGARGGSFVRVEGATERTFSPNTSAIGVNRYRVIVTNTNNASGIDGDRVVRATSQTATVTVTQSSALSPALPYVWVELSPALTAELQQLLGSGFNELEININTFATNTNDGFAVVDVSFLIDNEELNTALASQLPHILQEPNAYYTIFADFYGLLADGQNYHRIVAFHNGNILSGSIRGNDMIFSAEASATGRFRIAYVETLRRLNLSLSSYAITDLAGNVPTRTMDVLPIIQQDRALVPLRFIAEALGADVDWTNATTDRPLTVHITIDGQTLSFGIGEITPQLAALGMDIPAQIMNSRTMVPLRFVSEFFGAVVNWDSAARSIEIISSGTTSGASNSQTSNQPLNHSAVALLDRRAIEAMEQAMLAEKR